MNIGVLALQGAVREHIQMIERCKARGISIKRPHELSLIDALIIPGGESTTIGKLMEKYNFVETIRKLNADGLPVYGTCAGLILLAKKITEGTQPLLKLMDIEVKRNAFGRQRESFEADLDISELGSRSYKGVFIRAPWIESVGQGVTIMAKFDGKIIMARQDKLLVSAFHPELTGDCRIHEYFIEKFVKQGC
ncbi:MAG: pyridoxal 5'-phosphate synthase glutaminase subunit PdxT [Actinomycetota bacterium]|nr:pyridoxal 5'-phosphate synthase glutaminase subunit PdxT [Actinomycetota bacterium]